MTWPIIKNMFESLPPAYIGMGIMLVIIWWLFKALDKKEELIQKISDAVSLALNEQTKTLESLKTLINILIQKRM